MVHSDPCFNRIEVGMSKHPNLEIRWIILKEPRPLEENASDGNLIRLVGIAETWSKGRVVSGMPKSIGGSKPEVIDPRESIEVLD